MSLQCLRASARPIAVPESGKETVNGECAVEQITSRCRPIDDGGNYAFPPVCGRAEVHRRRRNTPGQRKHPAQRQVSRLPSRLSGNISLCSRKGSCTTTSDRVCVTKRRCLRYRSGTPSSSPRHSPRWDQKAASRPRKRHRRAQLDARAGLGTIATRRYRGGSVVGPGPIRSELLARGREWVCFSKLFVADE